MPKDYTFHFEMSERKLLLRIFDILVICANITALNYLFDKTHIYFGDQFWLWISIYSVYYMAFATVFELYVLNKAESRYKVFKNLVLTLSTGTILFLFTPFVTPELPPNRMLILHLFASNLTFLCLWRFFYISFITSPKFYKRILFVGNNFNIDGIVDELKIFDPNLRIVGYIDTSHKTKSSEIQQFDISDIQDVIKNEKVGEIVVANSYKGVDQNLYTSLTPLLKEGVPIKPLSKVYEDITNRILLKDVENDFYCYFPFSRSNQNKLYLSFCRVLDVAFSSLGLLFLGLLIPFIALINLFLNRGSLFYSQKRVGKSSKPFKIVKLRSMVKDAEKSGAQWASKNDTRITPFGKILRKTRIDELPQFINIFKGDMALIGPRPERPEFVEQLEKKIPFYETRHIIKPGLTGWAQVNAKYASSDDDTLEKLQYDLYYIKERSLFLDFRIIVKTVSTIVFFRGQ